MANLEGNEMGSIILLMEQDDLLNYGCLSMSPLGINDFIFFSFAFLFLVDF